MRYSVRSRLTTKLSHPGQVSVNRGSGTERANPGWLQRLVRTRRSHVKQTLSNNSADLKRPHVLAARPGASRRLLELSISSTSKPNCCDSSPQQHPSQISNAAKWPNDQAEPPGTSECEPRKRNREGQPGLAPAPG